ncbi:uncharacterized protein LOC122086290 [Macadamia integrifolia]|uniref:uncharacterized protein LOC122086290 n=1 Tax=Macadamia integrifolia TaxID=60698 RepID=UPI001C4EF0DB|nr:uncharacterized protein LOC122086290 [Macadamia integrifolia]
MPQGDLETLVCGVDRKVACESLVGDHHSPPDKPDLSEEAPPDFPAESFQISKEEELDWFDRNALYERKESHKGNSNPNSNSNSNSHSHTHSHPISNHSLNPNPSSQRFSLNFTPNTSIIGLPKPQKSCILSSKSRRSSRPPRPPFFPKRPSRSGKSLTVAEPSSPKVSCIGRVKSIKDKSLRSASARRPTEAVTIAKTSKSKQEKKTGFWANLMAILRSSCRDGSSVAVEGRPMESPSLASVPRWSFAERERKIPASMPLGEPTGLDGMKRFSSGRRSESWAVSDFDFEDSLPAVVVDSDAHSIWRRREVDPPKKIDCVRDWECEGPASV